MKRAVQLFLTSAITATLVSAAWWFHVGKVATLLTLISVKSDIRSELNILKKLDSKEYQKLKEDSENDLAISTVLLIANLKYVGRAEQDEYRSAINSIRQYRFSTTNEFTQAAINILARHDDQAPK